MSSVPIFINEVKGGSEEFDKLLVLGIIDGKIEVVGHFLFGIGE
jgi:Fe2+ transport system protein FeoA